MTKAEKRKLVRSLSNGIRDRVLREIDRYPEEWDGHELRLRLAELWAMEVTFQMGGRPRLRVPSVPRSEVSRKRIANYQAALYNLG